MKTLLTTLVLCVFTLAPVHAQKAVTAKQKMKVVIPDGSGTNAASIAWNPKNKTYYTCYAGNSTFPLYMFSKKGKITNTMTTRIDTRGFWFNENQNRLEGTAWNGAGYGPGYFYRTVDKKGVPGEDQYVKFPSMQEVPDYCIPAYDKDRDELVYIDQNFITRFSHKDGSEVGSVNLKLPSGVSWEDINMTTVIYTGKKGEEYGVLDFVVGKVYLFDMTSGNVTKTVTLPAEAPDPHYYCFAYANGMFWTYSTLSRTWYAYSHP